MKNYKVELREVPQVISITCDVCKKDYDNTFDTQEFLTYTNSCGYGSVFGDGTLIELDMCQHCQKSMLDQYFRKSHPRDVYEILHKR